MNETTLESKPEEALTHETNPSIESRRTYTPAIDIYDTDNSIVLLVNMPGVPEENVDITLEKRLLTIHGKVEHEAPEGLKAVYSEYTIGDYKRSFSLSDEVNQEEIEATLKHGVLRLELAKAEVAKPRQIEVHAAS